MDVVRQWNAPFRRTIQRTKPPLVSAGASRPRCRSGSTKFLRATPFDRMDSIMGDLGESNEMEFLYMTGGCNGNKV